MVLDDPVLVADIYRCYLHTKYMIEKIKVDIFAEYSSSISDMSDLSNNANALSSEIDKILECCRKLINM